MEDDLYMSKNEVTFVFGHNTGPILSSFFLVSNKQEIGKIKTGNSNRGSFIVFSE